MVNSLAAPKKYPPLRIICLAAGRGVRLKAHKPKPLVDLWGQPLLGYVMASIHTLMTQWQQRGSSSSWATVVDPTDAGGAVAAYAQAGGAEIYIQQRALGTADAVLAAAPFLSDPQALYLVMCADTPLIQADGLLRFLDTALEQANAKWAGSFLAMEISDAHHTFGCLDVDHNGRIVKILEAAERPQVSPTNRHPHKDLCNSGVAVLAGQHAPSLLQAIDNRNAKGEYYLTDLPVVADKRGLWVSAIQEADAPALQGVNTALDLHRAGETLQNRWRQGFIERGVMLQAPHTFYASYDTHLEPGAIIEPYVVCGPGVRVAAGAILRTFSHLEGTSVASGAVVGPYARLRPGSHIDLGARIGNFVEVKNSHIHEGAKVSHLSYIGDATVGVGANIGAGTITCNYDGQEKHRTEIGDGAFVGSNTALVAPVTVGDNALIGAGSVITKNVPSGALGIARSPQKNRENYVSKRPRATQRRPQSSQTP